MAVFEDINIAAATSLIIKIERSYNSLATSETPDLQAALSQPTVDGDSSLSQKKRQAAAILILCYLCWLDLMQALSFKVSLEKLKEDIETFIILQDQIQKHHKDVEKTNLLLEFDRQQHLIAKMILDLEELTRKLLIERKLLSEQYERLNELLTNRINVLKKEFADYVYLALSESELNKDGYYEFEIGSQIVRVSVENLARAFTNVHDICLQNVIEGEDFSDTEYDRLIKSELFKIISNEALRGNIDPAPHREQFEQDLRQDLAGWHPNLLYNFKQKTNANTNDNNFRSLLAAQREISPVTNEMDTLTNEYQSLISELNSNNFANNTNSQEFISRIQHACERGQNLLNYEIPLLSLANAIPPNKNESYNNLSNFLHHNDNNKGSASWIIPPRELKSSDKLKKEEATENLNALLGREPGERPPQQEIKRESKSSVDVQLNGENPEPVDAPLHQHAIDYIDHAGIHRALLSSLSEDKRQEATQKMKEELNVEVKSENQEHPSMEIKEEKPLHPDYHPNFQEEKQAHHEHIKFDAPEEKQPHQEHFFPHIKEEKHPPPREAKKANRAKVAGLSNLSAFLGKKPADNVPANNEPGENKKQDAADAKSAALGNLHAFLRKH